MLKNYLKLILTIIILFGLINCHHKKRTESKELLQKILQVVGIPYDIIINICQDDNSNGFCEKVEFQSKLIYSPKQGEIFWQKIEQISEGRYFLETYDYRKPILLELQDANRVDFNNGKFTLYFSGFNSDKENEEKEISVLQSMIDAKYLQTNETKGLRNLGNPYAQDKFYEYLFEGLEDNLNILEEKGFTSNEAMAINIEKMANKLIENNITTNLPLKINRCTDNECIDRELNVLSSILKISN